MFSLPYIIISLYLKYVKKLTNFYFRNHFRKIHIYKKRDSLKDYLRFLYYSATANDFKPIFPVVLAKEILKFEASA